MSHVLLGSNATAVDAAGHSEPGHIRQDEPLGPHHSTVAQLDHFSRWRGFWRGGEVCCHCRQVSLNRFGIEQVKGIIPEPVAEVFDEPLPLLAFREVELLACDHLAAGAAGGHCGGSAFPGRLGMQVEHLGLLRFGLGGLLLPAHRPPRFRFPRVARCRGADRSGSDSCSRHRTSSATWQIASMLTSAVEGIPNAAAAASRQ